VAFFASHVVKIIEAVSDRDCPSLVACLLVSEVPGHERYGGYGPFQHRNPQPSASEPNPAQAEQPQGHPPQGQPVESARPAATDAPTAGIAYPQDPVYAPAEPVTDQSQAYPEAAAVHPAPQSGAPYTAPQSGPPYQAPGHIRPLSGPPEADSWSMFPDGGPGSPSWQPRIVPTPKQPRGRIIGAALVGLLAGLLVFGPTGYLVGYRTAPAPKPTPSKPAASGAAALPPFERTLLELNKPKFTSELAPIATSWLPWISNCAKSGSKNGPDLSTGEEVRVACRYANTSIYFVQYKTADERDKAYTRHVGQNIDAKQMAPGVAKPTTKRTTSGEVNGRYVEYAFKTSSDANGKTMCGLWWSDSTTPIAAYLVAYWDDELGQSWEPMRDLWRRYS
jgi:hypothetical protein